MLDYAVIEKNKMFPLVPMKNYESKPYVKWKTDTDWIKTIEPIRQNKNMTGAALLTGEVSGIMVIDLDNKHDGINGVSGFNEKWPGVIDTLTVFTPNNGVHLYFKWRDGLKNRTDYFPGVDVRTTGGIIIVPGSQKKKDDGSTGDYTVVNDHPIAEIPEELFQLLKEQDTKKSKKTSSGKTGLLDGAMYTDGTRNDNLFRDGINFFSKSSYRDYNTILIFLQGLNLTKCVSPLPDLEIETIAKSVCDKLKTSVFSSEGRIIIFQLVEHIRATRPSYAKGNMVYFYDDDKGVYMPIDQNELYNIYFDSVLDDKDKTARKAKEFAELFIMLSREKEQSSFPEKTFINCINGVLNWETGELFPHSPDYKLSVLFKANHRKISKEDFEQSSFKKFLDTTLDQETQKGLQESFGLLLSPHAQEVQKAFIHLGDGANGKSVVFQIMSNLIGIKNVSSLSFADFDKEFHVSSMEGKGANIRFDDNLTNLNGKIGASWKSCVVGDDVSSQKKYKDVQTLKFNQSHYYGLNKLPAVSEKVHGFYRRIQILKYDKTFGDAEEVRTGSAEFIKNPMIAQNIISNEMDIVFAYAISGLKRLLSNKWQLTTSKATSAALLEYKVDSNSAYGFYLDVIERSPGDQILITDVIRVYKEWCFEQGIKAMDGRNLGKVFKSLGIIQGRTNKGRFYKDIKIIECFIDKNDAQNAPYRRFY